MSLARASLWVLEARPMQEDDRPPAAQTLKWWLAGEGCYVVGRPGAPGCDLPVPDDKSISRKHAELTVPPAGDGEPHVLLKDHSKYGTHVAAAASSQPGASSSLVPEWGAALGKAAPASRVTSGSLILFGCKSPFRLRLEDWVLYLGQEQRDAAGAAAVEALEAAAAAVGLPLTDQLPDHPGTRVLAAGGGPLRVDGALLLALLRGYPVVAASWLLEWRQQRVWHNARPQEAAHPVQLHYAAAGGRLKALAGPEAALAAAQRRALEGRTLLWLPAARGDAALHEAASLLGAESKDVAASGRAVAAAKGAGAVLVRGSADDAVPTAYRKLAWTTPQLLLAGILEGDPEGAVQGPAGVHDATPTPAKGRGKKGAAASTTGSGRVRGRARGRAAAAEEEEQEAGGSETDVSESELERVRDTQRHLALDQRSPPATAAQQAQQAQQQHGGLEGGEEAAAASFEDDELPKCRGQGAPPAAAQVEAGAGKAAPSSRKRRQPEPEQQPHGEAAAAAAAAEPTPAKRARQGAAAATPASAANPQQALSAADGWHGKSQHKGERAAPAHGAPAAAPPPAAAQPAASKPAPSTAGRPKGRRGRAGAAAPEEEDAAAAAAPAAAAADGSAAAAGEAAAAQQQDDEVELVEEADGTLVAYLPLVLHRGTAGGAERGRGAGSAAGGGGGGGPNYKAFRKGGGAAAPPPRAVVAVSFVPLEGDAPDAEAFLQAEAERRRRARAADDLFTANIKARKAAQLPDPDGDTPPKKGKAAGGRGRGGKKAAAPAGVQSLLNFMPAGGRGRGRGRGKA